TGQMRWLLFSQERGSTIPVPFLTVLVAWLAILLASFGLLAPGNSTTLLSLAACSLSVASAIFLILDLDHPYEGIIRISGEPLHAFATRLPAPWPRDPPRRGGPRPADRLGGLRGCPQ